MENSEAPQGEALKSNRSNNEPNGTKTSDAFVEIWIPRKLCSFVIGRKGANLKAVEAATETWINVFSEHTTKNVVPVRINGNVLANVERAKEELQKIIDSAPTTGGGNGVFNHAVVESTGEGGSRAGLIVRDTLPRQHVGNEPAATAAAKNEPPQATMWVPRKDCGVIIGKGGAQLKEIQETTNTWVNILTKDTTSAELVPVHINGQDALNVQRAQDVIHGLLQAKLQERVDNPAVATVDAAPVPGRHVYQQPLHHQYPPPHHHRQPHHTPHYQQHHPPHQQHGPPAAQQGRFSHRDDHRDRGRDSRDRDAHRYSSSNNTGVSSRDEYGGATRRYGANEGGYKGRRDDRLGHTHRRGGAGGGGGGGGGDDSRERDSRGYRGRGRSGDNGNSGGGRGGPRSRSRDHQN